MSYIYFFKKDIFFLKKYLFELYLESFNYKILKLKSYNLNINISKVKLIINIKLNENFKRSSFFHKIK
ncbi:hypothetical protein NASMSEV_030 [Candidatus Nasuia deltocephalinicola]|uniref:Uncharacterized protein n=1 Tax=Candidatus Nasuia deltocephalincola TaxID=1160784 RepID=A0A7G6UHK0_9PROT|nr:hypothetical protein NASMSEV_030 [Candidatus Nasuia deltocephalinicola]